MLQYWFKFHFKEYLLTFTKHHIAAAFIHICHQQKSDKVRTHKLCITVCHLHYYITH